MRSAGQWNATGLVRSPLGGFFICLKTVSGVGQEAFHVFCEAEEGIIVAVIMNPSPMAE